MIWQLKPLDETDRVKLKTHNKSTNQQDENKQEGHFVLLKDIKYTSGECQRLRNDLYDTIDKIGYTQRNLPIWQLPDHNKHLRYLVEKMTLKSVNLQKKSNEFMQQKILITQRLTNAFDKLDMALQEINKQVDHLNTVQVPFDENFSHYTKEEQQK